MAVTGADLVTEAVRHLGAPYVYGATGPTTFDCSGLMQYVYGRLGISIPRTSEEQATVGKAISRSDLQPGDLVFSAGADGTPSHPGHVAMYTGVGKVLEAPHTGAVVRIADLDSVNPSSYRRIIGTDSGGASGVVQASSVAPSSFSDIFSFPAEILSFFSTALKDLTATADFFAAFFRPSTYVRIGSGFFGTIFLAAGLFFLIREANT